MNISRECLCCHEVGANSQKMQDNGNDVHTETKGAYMDIKISSYSNNSICHSVIIIINGIPLYMLSISQIICIGQICTRVGIFKSSMR